MENLLEQFHSLDGITIAERKKSLHRLLSNPELAKHQDAFIAALAPKTFLEELFYLEVLIHLKRSKELLAILKGGNEILVSKVVKQYWLFKETFAQISEEEFVSTYLPDLSYSLRMKVLLRLSIVLPEAKVDKLFDAVVSRYGLFIAQTFISACSSDKIRQTLQAHEITLNDGHLQRFLKKDKSLIYLYIDELKKRNVQFNSTKFLKYVSRQDVDFYLELRFKYDLNTTSVGRRTTKKIITRRKDDILANPEQYENMLKESVVSRVLKKDFGIFYRNLFPKDITDSIDLYTCNRFLLHAPPKLRFDLMANTYRAIYNDQIENNDRIMSHNDNLEILAQSSPETCASVAMRRYDKTNDSKYLKYIPIEKSVPILREKINLTSNIYDRSRLLEQLIEACKYHKDLKALGEVMTYLCKRHRNDDRQTRTQLMNCILRCFKLKELYDVHWNCLLDLQKVQRMKEEHLSERLLLFHYMDYLLRCGKPIQEHMDLFINDTLEDGIWIYLDKDYNAELYRKVLLELIARIPSYKTEDHDGLDQRIIEQILKFNKKHPALQIDLYSTERFVKVLRNHYDSYTHITNITEIVCKKERKAIENEILDCFMKDYSKHTHQVLVKWFFENDILVVDKYFDEIAPSIVENEKKLWHLIRKYSHLQLDKRFVDYLQQQLSSEQKNKHKIKLIKPLVHVVPAEKYIKMTEHLIPKKDKIDLEDIEATELFNLQCEVAKSFRYADNQSTIFPTLLKYCTGDYLASALCSMYSAFMRIPETTVKSALSTLAQKAVSVRKHALFLSCTILPVAEVFQLLAHAGEQEKNLSVQKHLNSTSLKYFFKNPSPQTWQLVQALINSIDKSDLESIKNLTECKVPTKYRNMYWQAGWAYLERNKKDIPKAHTHMQKMLSHVDKNLIKELPLELLENIVEQYFLTQEELSKHDGVTNLVVLFLLLETRADPYPVVFKRIEHYRAQNPENKKLTGLFNEFVSNRKEPFFKTEQIGKLSKNWHTVFTPVEMFREGIILRVLHISSIQTDLKDFAKSISTLIKETMDGYGPLIFSKLSAHLKYSIGLLLDMDQKLDFIGYLLDANFDSATCIFAYGCLGSLPKKYKEREQVLIDRIMGNKQPDVQIFCNSPN